ncbi:MAG: UDP-N-acetylmuramoyl-tripeptide--D-alanyl-D-alanine ligase [Propionibacteriaceae bacterium]|jgi:UDP-N-acetylmuramoyl-tripeptide--D-alanyl-D-alanine ligase|nr:UDP-N-acetylmuramoyl-tripeptide--D-alanyl-D-alanine ligase [Propionibacteriaceae bacterium]
MKLRDAKSLAELTGGSLVVGTGQLIGPDVVIDSRLTTPGALFVALPGERVDGHDFVVAAARLGAGAALVERAVPVEISQIVVPDVLAALSAFATSEVAAAKARGLVTFALTGSSGKTTTKDLLADICASVAPSVSPVNSFNNQIGVPVTAALITEDTRYLVSELGASHVGEIARYAQIVQPHIAAVLNIGTAHLGEFGSRENIAAAKAEIVQELSATDWAIFNAADEYAEQMARSTTAQVGWFGGKHADAALAVRYRDLEFDAFERPKFTLYGWTPEAKFEVDVSMRLVGAHQVDNACAAAAMALAAGIEPEVIATSLSQSTPRSAHRMALHTLDSDITLIDDCYNANPGSVGVAINVLASIDMTRSDERAAGLGRTIAVLGDMLELGDESAALHHQAGVEAGEAGLDVLIAVGEFAPDIVAGFEEGFARSLRAARASVGESGGATNAVIDAKLARRRPGVLAKSKSEIQGLLELQPGDVVLLKASRGVGLETVVDALIEQFGRRGQSER